MRYDDLEKLSYLEPDENFKWLFRALYTGWALMKHKLHLHSQCESADLCPGNIAYVTTL